MWSSTIQRILSTSISSKSSSRSTSDTSTSLAPSTRYLPGMFWRQFVAKCVLFDLLEPQVQGQDGAADERRRIARMDEMGLGGIVMYAVPQNWTLERVFGDGKQHGSMGEQEFLDGIQVKLAYTPLYACTSFVTGQVMTAYLHGTDPPIPALAGLGFSASFSSFEHGIRLSKPVSLSTARRNLKPLPLSECASRFRVEHDRCSLTHCDNDEEDAGDWVEHFLPKSDGIDSHTPVVSDFLPCITTSLPPSPVPMALSVYALSTPPSGSEDFSLSESSSLLNVESHSTSISSLSSAESLGPLTPAKPRCPRLQISGSETSSVLCSSSSQESFSLEPLKVLKRPATGCGHGFGRGKENIPPVRS